MLDFKDIGTQNPQTATRLLRIPRRVWVNLNLKKEKYLSLEIRKRMNFVWFV